MLNFKKNMGAIDRGLRFIVGITLLGVGPVTNMLGLTTVVLIAMGGVGVFALFSALSAYCPLYEFTDSNTLKKKGD